ncbi:MAG: hypothetical protein A2V70_13945 [Planctomycetes bacterium RBG_13_63_9]|nr:MAG: hypothetical protein A2V70_13945 [Planctomycetes bacterium RBG_13_63_9]
MEFRIEVKLGCATIPSQTELQKLPGPAMIAFSARCARRLLPFCAEIEDKVRFAEQVGSGDATTSALKASLSGLDRPPSIETLESRIRRVGYAVEALKKARNGLTANTLTADSSSVARAVVEMVYIGANAVDAAKQCRHGADAINNAMGSFGRSHAQKAARAVQAAIRAAEEGEAVVASNLPAVIQTLGRCLGDAREALARVRDDFDRLMTAAKDGHWTDDKSVTTDFFGLL